MLAAWKTAPTSIVYNNSSLPSTATAATANNKKKKKSRKSSSALSSSSDAPSSLNFGAQFVTLDNGPQAQDKTNPSNSKKRRKVGNANKDHKNNDKNNSVPFIDEYIEEEVTKSSMICITSPHRVVFLENNKEVGNSASKARGASPSTPSSSVLKENELRRYISKPGTDSSFSLGCNNTIITETTTNNFKALSGLPASGVQYDPSANLIYGIRNSGAEIAIWSAAPCSMIAGPDEGVVNSSNGMNGAKVIASPNNAKKRMPHHHHQQQQQSTPQKYKGGITLERFQLPHGKTVTSLTPFSITLEYRTQTPKKRKRVGGSGGGGLQNIKTIGGAGCCDDGTIWVATRRSVNHSNDDKFHLHLLKEGSLLVNSNNDGSWKVLDSCISNVVGTTNVNEGKSSVVLSIQSVIMSTDKQPKVCVRNHQVRISNAKHSKHSTVQIEKYTSEELLVLETNDISAKIESGESSTAQLSIVHRMKQKNSDGSSQWMFTSGTISTAKGGAALNMSRSSFPLSHKDDMAHCDTVFSFGKVGKNITALLMQGQKESSTVMSLRIIDCQRKIQLSSVSWIEGELKDETTRAGNALGDMLQGKVCKAMITNESDGSIALLVSSNEPTENGSSSKTLDVVFSKLNLGSTMTVLTLDDDEPTKVVPTSGTSLASRLRFAATSAPPADEIKELTLRRQSFDMTGMISRDASSAQDARQRKVESAVVKACQLLTTSAKELIEKTIVNDNGENDKSIKGSKSSKKSSTSSISWKEVYRNGCTLVAEAKGDVKVSNHKKKVVNGIIDKSNVSKTSLTSEMPRGFVEVAFEQCATILLSLHRADAPTKAQKTFHVAVQEVTSILIECLQTSAFSARAEYGINPLLSRGNSVFLSILQACPTQVSTNISNTHVGKLHVINAILKYVGDIHETMLVSILRFVLRKVSMGDAMAFFNTDTSSDISRRGARLISQYKALADDAPDDSRKAIENKLLSEAVLGFLSKIVTYSDCSHTFLAQAMRDKINTNEVETLLLTLTRLLKNSTISDDSTSTNKVYSTSMGAIHWISALTDAHMGTVSKISYGDGVVIDRMKRVVRYAMTHSEFANGALETSNFIVSKETMKKRRMAKKPPPSSVAKLKEKKKDEDLPFYTMERLYA